MKKFMAIFILASAVFFTGCASYSSPVMPPQGFVYTNVTHPLTDHYDNTETGPGIKTASDNTRYLRVPFILFGLINFAWDDAAIEQIAKDGGISEISYAELEVTNVLGIYAEYEVIVHGK